ncbi:hypothetical protein Trydic_g11653 [Trypoxylus dichotomus]
MDRLAITGESDDPIGAPSICLYQCPANVKTADYILAPTSVEDKEIANRPTRMVSITRRRWRRRSRAAAERAFGYVSRHLMAEGATAGRCWALDAKPASELTIQAFVNEIRDIEVQQAIRMGQYRKCSEALIHALEYEA